MSAFRRVGVVAALVLLIGIGVAGLRSDDDVASDPQEVVALLPQPYEPSFVNLWVRGCVGSGESAAFCRCAIRVYTAHLVPHEFETVSAIAMSGGDVSQLPDHLRQVLERVERECP